MAVTLHHNVRTSRAAGNGLAGQILDAVYGFFASIERSFQARNTYTRLDAMSDEELSRRGLDRSDLARVACKDILNDSR